MRQRERRSWNLGCVRPYKGAGGCRKDERLPRRADQEAFGSFWGMGMHEGERLFPYYFVSVGQIQFSGSTAHYSKVTSALWRTKGLLVLGYWHALIRPP